MQSGTVSAALAGTGALIKSGTGTLTLSGVNTYTGPTTVNGGTLTVNGASPSGVTVNAGGSWAAAAPILGTVDQRRHPRAGQLDRHAHRQRQLRAERRQHLPGRGQCRGPERPHQRHGRARHGDDQRRHGQVLAQPGSYGTSTTYTILNATGGRTGTYTGVTSNFAFLTPSLSYDANNVFLTLALARTPSVGAQHAQPEGGGRARSTRSFASATGDFATVIGAIAGLNTAQGPRR